MFGFEVNSIYIAYSETENILADSNNLFHY